MRLDLGGKISITTRNDWWQAKNFWLQLESHQDSLLQAYRNIFISSQTIIVSLVAALLAIYNSSEPPIQLDDTKGIIFLFIIGISLLFLWTSLCYLKGLDVYYCQMQISRLEKDWIHIKEESEQYSEYKIWRKTSFKEKRKIINKSPEKYSKWDTYRLIMGFVLPSIYIWIWIILILEYFRMINQNENIYILIFKFLSSILK